jgi:hypothetical protein
MQSARHRRLERNSAGADPERKGVGPGETRWPWQRVGNVDDDCSRRCETAENRSAGKGFDPVVETDGPIHWAILRVDFVVAGREDAVVHSTSPR